jgi:hypothetical protein
MNTLVAEPIVMAALTALAGLREVSGGVEGLFGLGPTYVTYPAPAPVVYQPLV